MQGKVSKDLIETYKVVKDRVKTDLDPSFLLPTQPRANSFDEILKW